MPYFGDTYLTDIRPVLQDWLTNSGTGKNVTNLPLTLTNRAQKNLWAKKPWSNLVVRVAMTLTSGAYTLPADFGRIIDVWADLNGQGTPTYWFYDGDSYEHGFRIDAGFTKAAGYARVLTFNYLQQSNVYIRYQKILSDFTGSGTEYSYFPANLILLEAQKINTLEKGSLKEWQAVSMMFDELFKEFCNATQWVVADATPRINDRFGNEIITESYSLGGDGSRPYNENPEGFIL